MGVRDAPAKYLVVDVDGFAADGAPSGYRRTEAGVIPSDWLVIKLSDLCEVLTGLTYRPSDVDSDGIIVLRSSNIQNGQLVLDDNVFVRSSAVPEKVVVRSGDILICVRNGSRELIGKSALIPVMNMRAAFGAFMAVLRSSESAFVHHAFKSELMQQQVRERLGATINQITRAGFEAFVLPAPSLSAERREIAEALSDADALIESLQQLITKKRALKQGAMQALLTGTQRLPGFSCKWVEVSLGDIAEVVMGQSPSSSHYNTKGVGLPLIQGNADVHGRTTIKRVFTDQITKLGRAGDVLMSVRAPVGRISRTEFDVCLGRGVCAIRYPNDFVFHALVWKENDWSSLSKGSTFDSVNSADVKSLSIKLPKDSEEQGAVAAVLSDMDAEIGALETRLAKACDIKAGMMQALLTGRIRLPLDQAV